MYYQSWTSFWIGLPSMLVQIAALSFNLFSASFSIVPFWHFCLTRSCRRHPTSVYLKVPNSGELLLHEEIRYMEDVSSSGHQYAGQHRWCFRIYFVDRDLLVHVAIHKMWIKKDLYSCSNLCDKGQFVTTFRHQPVRRRTQRHPEPAEVILLL